HCHDLDTLPIGLALGKFKRKPVVYDAHEIFIAMLGKRIHSAVRSCLQGLEKFMIRRVNLLITTGERLRRYFMDRGAPHVVVVGNWKRLEDFSRTAEQSADIRKRLGIPV